MNDSVVGKNKKLRQALSCAFDFPTWKRFYNNSVEFAPGPVPSTVEGFLDKPFEYAFDFEKAKRLIAEAGYPEGIDPKSGKRLEITLTIGRPTQDSREAGELLASFYAKIGVKLNLKFLTWHAFLSEVNKGNVQLYMLAWVADYPDPENFLQLFFQFFRRGGGAALTGPGVRVVTATAPQMTPLQKRHKPHAGSIYSTQGLDGVNPAHHKAWWKVRLMTSRCCSRDSLQKLTA